MTSGLKNLHLPGLDATSRAVNALRSSVAQLKAIVDSGVTDTVDIVTDVYDDGGTTKYHYRELAIEDGVITAIGDEETGTVS